MGSGTSLKKEDRKIDSSLLDKDEQSLKGSFSSQSHVEKSQTNYDFKILKKGYTDNMEKNSESFDDTDNIMVNKTKRHGGMGEINWYNMVDKEKKTMVQNLLQNHTKWFSFKPCYPMYPKC